MRACVIALCVLFAAPTFTLPVKANNVSSGSLSDGQTARVVGALENMFLACGEVTVIYQPDCLTRAAQRAAGKISNNPGYWEAWVALTRVARNMSDLVRANEDDNERRVRLEGYRLRPVTAESLGILAAAAQDLIAQADRDLRSGSSYEIRYFSAIADSLATGRTWP